VVFHVLNKKTEMLNTLYLCKKKLLNHLQHIHTKANARMRENCNGQIYKRVCAGLFSLFFSGRNIGHLDGVGGDRGVGEICPCSF
jgi:hypothetical protein